MTQRHGDDPDRDRGKHDRGHPHGHGEGWGAHGNPEDLDHFIEKMTDPERIAWQKPDQVLAALELRPGMTVAEIGVGPGYWVTRAAKLVGERGAVFAVDVEPRMFEVLHRVLETESLGNITPVFGRPGDPLLPTGLCDLVLIINTYHHFPDGPAYLRKAARALKPAGRLVNIDFRGGEQEIGPPPDHKIDKADFIAQARKAGLRVTADHDELLEYQYFIELVAE